MKLSSVYFFESLSTVLQWIVIVLCLVVFVKFLWKRRWLYYYSAVLPGPFSLPIVGSIGVIFAGQKQIFKTCLKLNEKYPSICRVWLGHQFCISTSRLADVEYILNNCLSKKHFWLYQYMEEEFSSIFSTNLNRWKKNRKIINPIFNQKMLNSYFSVMVKRANNLLKDLDENADQTVDLLPTVWSTTLRTSIESIGTTDTEKCPVQYKRMIEWIVRFEELIIERSLNPLYHVDFIWQLSRDKKELNKVMTEIKTGLKEGFEFYMNSVVPKMVAESNNSLPFSFGSCLLKGDYTQDQILGEIGFMHTAASETVAVATCTVLLVMGIYPDIQEKLYQEQKQIFTDDREITPEDLTHMDYLDRVIKETMRLAPVAPGIARYIDKTVTIDGQTYPEGTIVIIPILVLHRQSEFWRDPLKFDPDRFLPDEKQKRPPGAYLPFSLGSRNCIGRKFGFNEIKILLSKIIRKFEVSAVKYKSLTEIEMVFHIVAKPEDGFKILLHRRN